MTFKGWQKTSLIEYPGQVATVLFAGGCSFRCPYCYNSSLVLAPERIPDLDGEVVLSYLEASRGLYQAVMVSGGEPTLDPGLPEFLGRVGRLGLLRGLSTNGSRPQALGGLLERGLLEYVAMDVKAPLNWEAYRNAAGMQERDRPLLDRVRESIALLLGTAIQVEFRCTAVPGLHSAQDLLALAGDLRGARRLALQAFRPGPTLAPALAAAEPYPVQTLQAVAQQARGWLPCVEVRQ